MSAAEQQEQLQSCHGVCLTRGTLPCIIQPEDQSLCSVATCSASPPRLFQRRGAHECVFCAGLSMLFLALACKYYCVVLFCYNEYSTASEHEVTYKALEPCVGCGDWSCCSEARAQVYFSVHALITPGASSVLLWKMLCPVVHGTFFLCDVLFELMSGLFSHAHPFTYMDVPVPLGRGCLHSFLFSQVYGI